MKYPSDGVLLAPKTPLYLAAIKNQGVNMYYFPGGHSFIGPFISHADFQKISGVKYE